MRVEVDTIRKGNRDKTTDPDSVNLLKRKLRETERGIRKVQTIIVLMNVKFIHKHCQHSPFI